MITPVKPISFPFTSDGLSTALVVDLSTMDLGIGGPGTQVTGLQSVQLTRNGYGAGVVAGCTAQIAGSILTIAFNAPLPVNDSTAFLITYTFSALVQLASLPLPPQ